MPETIIRGSRLFTGDEDGFELETSPGVTVSPLLAKDAGSTVDLFYLTVAGGAEVNPERHPYSETLVVVDGELMCSTENGPGVVVLPPGRSGTSGLMCGTTSAIPAPGGPRPSCSSACDQVASRIDRNLARSLRLARRMAAAMNGAASFENPAGSPRLRKVICVLASSVAVQV